MPVVALVAPVIAVPDAVIVPAAPIVIAAIAVAIGLALIAIAVLAPIALVAIAALIAIGVAAILAAFAQILAAFANILAAVLTTFAQTFAAVLASLPDIIVTLAPVPDRNCAGRECPRGVRRSRPDRHAPGRARHRWPAEDVAVICFAAPPSFRTSIDPLRALDRSHSPSLARCAPRRDGCIGGTRTLLAEDLAAFTAFAAPAPELLAIPRQFHARPRRPDRSPPSARRNRRRARQRRGGGQADRSRQRAQSAAFQNIFVVDPPPVESRSPLRLDASPMRCVWIYATP